MALMPSPGNCTTPVMGLVENGGTNAATLLPMDLVYCNVSQVPSISIAALPLSNSWMLLVFVSTSGLVQPLESSLCQLARAVTLADDVQGIEPLYRPFQSAT